MSRLPSRLPGVKTRLAAALALAIAVTALTVFLVHQHHEGASAATAPAAVDIGPNTCGQGWVPGRAGSRRIRFTNSFENGSEAYLVADATGKVLLDAEGIGLGATRTFAVTLGPGRYHFVCVNPESGVPVTGASRTVAGSLAGTGDAPTTAGVHVVSSNDLIPAIQSYGSWVGSRLPVLHGLVVRLESDLSAGDVARAKHDWLSAHLTYETLGAAYDAFGDADAQIDPLPSRSVAPAEDPALVGFPKIEALLWSGAPPAAAVSVARQLAAAVAGLTTSFANGRDIKPVEMGLRSHEILENAVQVQLTGRDDAGSHTELATIDANLAGTRRALDAIRPLVARQLDLAPIDAWLQRSTRLVESFRHHGVWTPFTALTQAEHEQLDATLSQTVEELSQVAVVTDPRQALQ